MKRFAKPLCAVLFAVLLIALVAVLPADIYAATIDSGTCGDGVTWTLDDEGTLTISGTGAMDDFEYDGAPWQSYFITKVVIKSGVTGIGKNSFSECRQISDVSIANTVTSIGERAFQYCESLSSVSLPTSIKIIGDWAFSNTGLTSVTIPNSVESLGMGAFSFCENLKTASVSASVTEMGDWVFTSDPELTSITVDSKNTVYSSVDGVLFNKDKTELITYPCNKAGTSYSIPSTVTTLIEYCFSETRNLTSMTIPSSVTSIGDWAFSESSLKTVKIPSSVTDIGGGLFMDCRSLTSITVDSANPELCASDGILYTKNKDCLICYPAGKTATSFSIPNTVKYLDSYSFLGCKALKTITIPSSVEWIGGYVFRECTSLTSMVIPNSVKVIYYQLFYGCTSLKTVILPDTIKTMSSNMFTDCTSLQYVNIPNSVETIDRSVFNNCTALKSVMIPKSVTSINYYAFENCDALADIYYEGTKAQWNSIQISDLNDSLNNATFHYSTYLPFGDVAPSSSYFKALHWAYTNGIVAGTSSNIFTPNDNCTRGQFALMLWRMNGKPSISGMKNPFKDVKSTNGFYKGIVWCYNQGITAGTSATTYSPNDNIKRWQMILMFWRMQGKPASSLTSNPFTDVNTTASYYKAALWAYEKGITGVKQFKPNDLCTRWQLVLFLYRLNNLYHYI